MKMFFQAQHIGSLSLSIQATNQKVKIMAYL
jgi:hypothetical protein